MDSSLHRLLFMFLFQLLKVKHYWALAKRSPNFLRHIFGNNLSFPKEKCRYYSGQTAEPHLQVAYADHLMNTYP